MSTRSELATDRPHPNRASRRPRAHFRAKRENAAMSEGVESTPNPWRFGCVNTQRAAIAPNGGRP